MIPLADDTSRQAHDILMKRAVDLAGGRLPEILGLDLPPIAEGLPAEVPRGKGRALVVDRLFRLVDASHLHLEIQKRRAANLRRSADVGVRLVLRDNVVVHTVVLYTLRRREAPGSLRRGSLVYNVHNVYLGRQDGRALLERLAASVAAGNLLDDRDTGLLLMAPLMRHTGMTTLAAATAALELTASIARSEEREPCRAAIVILTESLLTEPERARLMEVFAAVSMSVAEMLVAKGEAKGEAKGKAEGVLLVLNVRFPDQPPAPALEARVMAEQDVPTLNRWMRLAATCTSVEDFAARA